MDAFAAAKTGIDLFRGAIGLAKDARSILPDGEKKEIVGRALEEAEKQIGIAEAQIAKALGYPLCRCIFTPTRQCFWSDTGHQEDMILNMR